MRLYNNGATAAARIAVSLAVACLVLAGCSSAPAATQIEATGSIDTHDPSLIVDNLGTDDPKDDVWYVYATGDGARGLGSPQIKRSLDQGSTWEEVGPAWKAKDEPNWSRSIVEGVENFWAPEVYEHDGTYYMYYSASTFGSNTSLIGLYTNVTLDPDAPEYRWDDQGEVLRSDGMSPYNAIDPGIIEDQDGAPWMVYGSFWKGLFMVPLEWPSGKLPGMDGVQDDPLSASGVEPIQVANRGAAPNAIEAGFITERDGWFYLFYSQDFCCKGTDSSYNIAVGRSESVTGPYLDANDVSLLDDGGTQVLQTHGSMVGPGGQSVAQVGDEYVLAFHYYDETLGGQFQLGLRRLNWSKDGWPIAQLASELEAANDR